MFSQTVQHASSLVILPLASIPLVFEIYGPASSYNFEDVYTFFKFVPDLGRAATLSK